MSQSEARQLLDTITARGLGAELRAGVLFIGPRERIDDDLHAAIQAHIPDLMAALVCAEADVECRVAAMLKQLLPLAWPCTVPALVAGEAPSDSTPPCPRCVAPDVGAGQWLICAACARAKAIALDLWLQRPARDVKADDHRE